MHDQPHPRAGLTVRIASGEFKGQDYRIEDWWDRVSGRSWRHSGFHPAGIAYTIRAIEVDQLPEDDEVLYGKVGRYGALIHVSEIEDE